MENRRRMCPFCGRSYTEPPALSRADNTAEICPDCGMLEALASVPKQQHTPKYCPCSLRRNS